MSASTGRALDLRMRAALEALLTTDAYKLGHAQQYPPGTDAVFVNFTARASRIAGVDATVFFGLQAALEQLNEAWAPFFGLRSGRLNAVLDEYRRFVRDLIGTDAAVDTEKFEALHAIGYLPLRIRAFREGQIVPIKVPYLTVENTDASAFWLPTYLETVLSASLWQPITTATLAWRMRRMLDAQAARSGDPEAVPFQAHDFSFRGMAGVEAAAASGAAHLTSLVGTDTLPAISYAQHYYPGSPAGEVIGASCAATEHSVMCAQGRAGEFEVFARLLDAYPSGVLALVSDSYDLWRVLTDYLPRLREPI
ncbi:MAG: nicotinamide phosphoribosyltransferase domain-containing protein, partial [Gordonia amarae]